jgi:hypothetical protein
MYRIHFDHRTSQFIVQILVFGVLWCNAKLMHYDTLEEARARVTAIGLDQLYADRSADKFRQHLRAAQGFAPGDCSL